MKNKEIDDLLDQLFRQAQMQFGSTVKDRWLHDGDGCPGCGKAISVTKYKKKDALSLNAFIFREHRVLIAYMLCGQCAGHIFREAKKNPNTKLPVHDAIEKTLKEAFVKHLGH
jgi:predicted metal-binding protein